MFSLFASNHTFSKTSRDFSKVGDFIETPLPGVVPIPKSSLPPALKDLESVFASIFMEDGKKVSSFDGVLINTVEKLESNSLKIGINHQMARRSGIRVRDVHKFREQDSIEEGADKEDRRRANEKWVPVLWVVEHKIVDKEDKDRLEDVTGDELMEKMKDKGLVVKEWLDQGQVLGHKSVDGFVSHCWWNSVVEAAWYEVRLLGWPQDGDQTNAEVVEKSGLGMWAEDWGWAGDHHEEVMIIKGEEIGGKL